MNEIKIWEKILGTAILYFGPAIWSLLMYKLISIMQGGVVFNQDLIVLTVLPILNIITAIISTIMAAIIFIVEILIPWLQFILS